MPEIRAIVFDSNVFGKQALPKMKTIRLWARACAKNNAELWIPEVVACELAQHAVEVHTAFSERYSVHLQRLEEWGQIPGEQLRAIGIDDVLSAMRTAGAKIVPLYADEAREAILDQVLLRGVGTRKSGIKTGAADSAWIRSVIAHNDGDSDGLIVITGDTGALERTCMEMDVTIPQNGAHLGAINHLLDDSSPASEKLTAMFEDWVQNYFVTGLANPRDEGARLAEAADLGFGNWWEIDHPSDDGYETWELQEQIVGLVKEAEIVGGIEHDEWTDALTATVRLVADVEEQYARQDPLGNHVQYRMRAYPGAVRGDLRLFIENEALSSDGVLEDIELLPISSSDIVWTSI